mmetsp:Transcript_26127/g.58887  ORF Transcript_26127/g.58887 Transcript_26127/m.58887 type:complete len:319 (-) Transcript_26127:88-1044(-)
MSSSSPRRSTRSTKGQKKRTRSSGAISDWRWRDLNQDWRQHYIDLGHGRIAKCTLRLLSSSDQQIGEIRSLGLSFAALAVSSISSVTGRIARADKERDLLAYLQAATDRNLELNDVHNGECTTELAAYYGLEQALVYLLDHGCPLKKPGTEKNAVYSAVTNGQHGSLKLMLERRPREVRQVIRNEEGECVSTFWLTMRRMDFAAARMLKNNFSLRLSDRDVRDIYTRNRARKFTGKLANLLREICPDVPNVLHWQECMHWSFSTTAKREILWLLAASSRHVTEFNPLILPNGVWLRILNYFGRDDFADNDDDVVDNEL